MGYNNGNINSNATGSYGGAFGRHNLTQLTSGQHNYAFGSFCANQVTSGDRNVCLGREAGQGFTGSSDNICIGYLANSYGDATGCNIAIGDHSSATGIAGVCIGSYANVIGSTSRTDGPVAVGYETYATSQSVAIGPGSSAESIACVAIGKSARAFGSTSIAIGAYATATGTRGIAMGYGAKASYAGSMAFGTSTVATGTNLVVFGVEDGQRTFVVIGSTAWASTSDENLKQNIRPLEYGLDLILKVTPIHYEYISRPEMKCIGFGAQTTKRAMDELGIEDFPGYKNDGMGLNIAPGEFVPVLVKAVQELKSEITQLKINYDAKMEALEARLAALE
jgi:hypothetical protein